MITGEVLPRRFLAFVAAAFGLWVVFGVVVNPLFSDQRMQANAILAGEAIAALVVWTTAFVRASQIPDAAPALRDRTPTSPATWLMLTFIFCGAWFLHRWYWFHPRLNDDDYLILAASRSWASTREHLFKPFNEHLLVPTYLWTFAAVHVSSPNAVPYLLLSFTWTLYLAASLQLFVLAKREFGDASVALLATAGFILSYVHHECLWWFTAGQWGLWALNAVLAVWLILDPRRPTNSRANFAGLVALLAPFACSTGMVVGPCAAVWILARWRTNQSAWWRPMVGGLIGGVVAMFLIKSGLREQDASAANVKLQWFSFDLWGGLGTTARLVVDQFVFKLISLPTNWVPFSGLFSAIGISAEVQPSIVAAIAFPFVAAVPVVALTRRPSCWRLAPFLVLIVLNYGLIVPFRSWMDYPQLANWGARYHLLPQLGLVLFLAGAWTEFRRTARPTPLWVVGWLSGLWFIFQETSHRKWVWP